jgi:uncharacterized protein
MSSLRVTGGIKSLRRCDLHKTERDDDASGPGTPEGCELPVIADCEKCGACCLDVGAPPDYVALTLNPGLACDPTFVDDAERLVRLPVEARRLLTVYLHLTESNPAARNGVCTWFDEVTKGCGFYDWRPSTCRVFERGSPGCRLYRRRHGIETLDVDVRD